MSGLAFVRTFPSQAREVEYAITQEEYLQAPGFPQRFIDLLRPGR